MNTIHITQSDYKKIKTSIEMSTSSTPEDKKSHAALSGELARAKIVPDADLASEVIRLGSRAQMTELGSGDVWEFTLVLPWEANPSEGKISILAPLGTAMLGFRSGETFEWTMPGGTMRYHIDSVRKPETPE